MFSTRNQQRNVQIKKFGNYIVPVTQQENILTLLGEVHGIKEDKIIQFILQEITQKQQCSFCTGYGHLYSNCRTWKNKIQFARTLKFEKQLQNILKIILQEDELTKDFVQERLSIQTTKQLNFQQDPKISKFPDEANKISQQEEEELGYLWDDEDDQDSFQIE